MAGKGQQATVILSTLSRTLPSGWTHKVLPNPERAVVYRPTDFVEVPNWVDYLPMWAFLMVVEDSPTTIEAVANAIKSKRAYADENISGCLLAARNCAFFQSSNGVSSAATWVTHIGPDIWEFTAVAMMSEDGSFPMSPKDLGEQVFLNILSNSERK